MPETKPNLDHASYLAPVYTAERLRETLWYSLKELRKHKFEAIAFRGMSGALIAPMLAYKLRKTLLITRKPNEKNHSWRNVEGDKDCKSYVIVDDLISSGETFRAIVTSVKLFAPSAKLVGVYLYTDPNGVFLKPDSNRISVHYERALLAAAKKETK